MSASAPRNFSSLHGPSETSLEPPGTRVNMRSASSRTTLCGEVPSAFACRARSFTRMSQSFQPGKPFSRFMMIGRGLAEQTAPACVIGSTSSSTRIRSSPSAARKSLRFNAIVVSSGAGSLQSRCSNRVLRSQTAEPARRRAENGQRRFIVDGILRFVASVVGAEAAAPCHRWLGIGWARWAKVRGLLYGLGVKAAGARFREAVAAERPLQVVGCIYAYAARMAERGGFKAIYLSGGGVAARGVRGVASAAGGWVYLRVCRAHGGAGRVQGDLPLRGRRGGGVARRAGPRHH